VRVLVVGLEPVTRAIVDLILRGAGHEVVCRDASAAGLAALAAAAATEEGFTLLLVDAALPDGGAAALCRQALCPDAPWVVVLASTPEEASCALAAGAIEVVAKPIDRTALLGCLARLAPYLAADPGQGTVTCVGAASGRPSQGTDSLVGKLLDGKYEVLERIGEGGMGSVYRARHVLVDEPVAVKVIRGHLTQRPASRARFLREARTNMRLCHPNVIAVRECGATQDGMLYMALDYSPGVSLKALLRDHGPMAEARVLCIARQVAEGLRAAHEHGVVHRDLKPDNVLLEAGDVVRVCDFGLAKLFDDPADAGITTDGLVVGTPHYMSPEQCEGRELDGRADLYALGCLLFECLTAEHVFDAASATSILDRHLLDAPPSPSAMGAKVSPRFEALVLRLLAKDPDDRPASAQAVIDALAQLERARASRGMRVLLADDSGASRTLLTGLLERWGHTVTLASDGGEAVRLAVASDAHFGAILLNGKMPGLDGVDAAALIRANEGFDRRVPIVLLTSSLDPADREGYADAGVDVVLPKPCRPEALASALGQITARPQTSAGPIELFDKVEALDRVEGDLELLGMTLAQLLSDSERLEEQLVAAVAAGDPRAVARAAHELRGAASNCSAGAVCQAATRLEAVAKEAGPLGPALDRLRRALERTRPVLRKAIRGEAETTPVRRPAA